MEESFMTSTPLMPKATAVWLVDNTSLTFDQIAEFCGLHVLEVKGIADGDVAQGIKGLDPISSGQLTRDEIKRGQENSGYKLKILRSKVELPNIKTKKKPKYTPVSRRQDRPNAILWLVKYHPELKDSQIIRLVGTTKPTILSIRERTHWNSANLQPADPVTLGLCTQTDLDKEVGKASKRLEKEQGDQPVVPTETLLPTEVTTGALDSINGLGDAIDDQEADDMSELDAADVFGTSEPQPKIEAFSEEEQEPDADTVFAGFGEENKEE